VIIQNHVLLQIDVVLFDYIMFSKACIRGRNRNASAWSMVLMVSLQAYLFCFLVSGGRPEGSKHNLKFQSAMWHHFKHLQSKIFFSLLPFFHST
jgi:5-carboxymethyl-2-hydroxymuconate isomerase